MIKADFMFIIEFAAKVDSLPFDAFILPMHVIEVFFAVSWMIYFLIFRLWKPEIPKRCRRAYPNEPWRCFFGYRIYPYIKSRSTMLNL